MNPGKSRDVLTDVMTVCFALLMIGGVLIWVRVEKQNIEEFKELGQGFCLEQNYTNMTDFKRFVGNYEFYIECDNKFLYTLQYIENGYHIDKWGNTNGTLKAPYLKIIKEQEK